MKKYLLSLVLSSVITFSVTAQSTDYGKSYYDKEKTKPKEVFSVKEKVSFNPNNPDEPKTSIKLKHGPYFFYHENGKIKTSGSYREDKKHGEWKHYDDKGNTLKIEQFELDVLKESKDL